MSTPATFAALDHFTDLAERRLYGILIHEAERQVARIERDDCFVKADAALKAHSLFTAARELRDGRA